MGRLISDRMSYRNHYMCSGEATNSKDKSKSFLLFAFLQFEHECKTHKIIESFFLSKTTFNVKILT